MEILITGGAGFVGQRLVAGLLELEGLIPGGDTKQFSPITQIHCFDRAAGQITDPRVRYSIGDIGDPATVKDLINVDTRVIFHLAAVVSGSAEADFDLGMRANLQGIEHLLARARALGHCPQVVFSSSIAVFGGPLPAVITDATTPMPQGSYGVQKLIGEQLIQDYSRKGFIRGCSLRLPAVLIRPGAPNGAASGFSSAIIREPLANRAMVLPVEESTEMWASAPNTVVANLVHAAQLSQQRWGANRTVNLPGSVVSMRQALDTLESIGGATVRSLVTVQEDPAVKQLVNTWAARFETPRAFTLGFEPDAGFAAMVAAYIRDNPSDVLVPLNQGSLNS